MFKITLQTLLTSIYCPLIAVPLGDSTFANPLINCIIYHAYVIASPFQNLFDLIFYVPVNSYDGHFIGLLPNIELKWHLKPCMKHRTSKQLEWSDIITYHSPWAGLGLLSAVMQYTSAKSVHSYAWKYRAAHQWHHLKKCFLELGCLKADVLSNLQSKTLFVAVFYCLCWLLWAFRLLL